MSKLDKPSAPSSARIHWIDVAKGIGIILVSFGHLRNGDGQSVWLPSLEGPIEAIYIFHMPLFFFLGGLTFSERKPFKIFLKRKTQTLLVPYYIFSMYFLAKPIALLIMPTLSRSFKSSHDYSLAHQFYGILIMGNGLWFLWAFFIGEILTFGLARLIKTRRYDLGIGVLLLALYFTVSAIAPALVLPFQIVKGVEVSGFIFLGLAAKRALLQLPNDRKTILSAGLVLLLFLVFSYITLSYPHFVAVRVTSLLSLFTGIGAAVLLSISINKSRILEYIGRNSLVFYSVNALTLNIVKYVIFRIFKIPGVSLSSILQWLTGIIVTALALLLMSLISIFVQRWLWWSIGKTKPSVSGDSSASI